MSNHKTEGLSSTCVTSNWVSGQMNVLTDLFTQQMIRLCEFLREHNEEQYKKHTKRPPLSEPLDWAVAAGLTLIEENLWLNNI